MRQKLLKSFFFFYDFTFFHTEKHFAFYKIPVDNSFLKGETILTSILFVLKVLKNRISGPYIVLCGPYII